ncbi:hypothetical protein RND81_11G018400 [Saponaria officinalis]|uniref:RNA-binding protein 48 n=1 Tax=Saponaria officinalis TaxID=3572 RepID=A0AAW1HH59_SAPOF
MPKYKDEPSAIRVYTVCDESKYLIVRNVPALGCGEELNKLFATYGDVEECKPMDAEECEEFTDVYWIKFRYFPNARFAKRKLDESVFLGNRLQVSYAPEYESLSDTKEKLEVRRKEVLVRLKPGKSKGYEMQHEGAGDYTSTSNALSQISQKFDQKREWSAKEIDHSSQIYHPPVTIVSSDKDYFPSQSMNATVKMVREKLDKIESNSSNVQPGPASKKLRVDNRRRI